MWKVLRKGLTAADNFYQLSPFCFVSAHRARMKRFGFFVRTYKRLLVLAKVERSSAAIIRGKQSSFQLLVRSSYGMPATHFGKSQERVFFQKLRIGNILKPAMVINIFAGAQLDRAQIFCGNCHELQPRA